MFAVGQQILNVARYLIALHDQLLHIAQQSIAFKGCLLCDVRDVIAFGVDQLKCRLCLSVLYCQALSFGSSLFQQLQRFRVLLC